MHLCTIAGRTHKMAGRLANLRVLAQRARAPQAYLPTRGGGGGPVKMGRPVDSPVSLFVIVLPVPEDAGLALTALLLVIRLALLIVVQLALKRNLRPASYVHRLLSAFASPCAQLPEQDELLWDDGSAQPEYCLDQFPLVGKVRPVSLPFWIVSQSVCMQAPAPSEMLPLCALTHVCYGSGRL